MPPIHIDLSDSERLVLRSGLLEWSGPLRPTDAMAVALGFTDAASIAQEAWALWQQIDDSAALTASDWKRVLRAVETAVAESGADWRFTSGLADEETTTIIHELRRKLPGDQFVSIPLGRAVETARLLESIVVSLDRIGSLEEAGDAEKLNQFVNDWRIGPRLSDARFVLWDAIAEVIGEERTEAIAESTPRFPEVF